MFQEQMLKPSEVVSPEVKRAFETVIIDPETQQLIDQFLVAYGKENHMGALRQVVFEGDRLRHIPRPIFNGKQLLAFVLESFHIQLCLKHVESKIDRDSLLSNIRLMINRQNLVAAPSGEQSIRFTHWKRGFPHEFSTLDTIIFSNEALKDIMLILDRLLINKARALADQLLATAGDLDGCLSVCQILVGEKLYDQDASDFVKFKKDWADFSEKRYFHLYEDRFAFLKRNTGFVMIGNELKKRLLKLFQFAPLNVQKNVMKHWNRYIAYTFETHPESVNVLKIQNFPSQNVELTGYTERMNQAEK